MLITRIIILANATIELFEHNPIEEITESKHSHETTFNTPRVLIAELVAVLGRCQDRHQHQMELRTVVSRSMYV